MLAQSAAVAVSHQQSCIHMNKSQLNFEFVLDLGMHMRQAIMACAATRCMQDAG
jgi:hypothetical protein